MTDYNFRHQSAFIVGLSSISVQSSARLCNYTKDALSCQTIYNQISYLPLIVHADKWIFSSWASFKHTWIVSNTLSHSSHHIQDPIKSLVAFYGAQSRCCSQHQFTLALSYRWRPRLLRTVLLVVTRAFVSSRLWPPDLAFWQQLAICIPTLVQNLHSFLLAIPFWGSFKTPRLERRK